MLVLSEYWGLDFNLSSCKGFVLFLTMFLLIYDYTSLYFQVISIELKLSLKLTHDIHTLKSIASILSVKLKANKQSIMYVRALVAINKCYSLHKRTLIIDCSYVYQFRQSRYTCICFKTGFTLFYYMFVDSYVQKAAKKINSKLIYFIYSEARTGEC